MIRYERQIAYIFKIAAILSGTAVLLILASMLISGFPLFRDLPASLFSFNWDPMGEQYGILAFIVGSLSISLTALGMAFPISISYAALMIFHEGSILQKSLRKIMVLMSGIPTVIYGFVGIFVLIPFVREVLNHGSGFSILSAALLTVLLITPVLVLVFYNSFKSVPAKEINAIKALGGTETDLLLYGYLPSAKKGIITGLLLGFGRAIGDTLIALMVAGNTLALPGRILDGARTLTSHIALIFAADFESHAFKAVFACGLFLYLMTTAIALTTRSLSTPSSGEKEMRRITQLLIPKAIGFFTLSLLAIVLSFIFYLFYKGLPQLSSRLLFETTEPMDALLLKEAVIGGIFPAIAGTFLLVLLSVIMAVPIGIMTGIFLSEYAQERSRRIFNLLYDILAGLPSIVIGLFGLSVSIFLHRYLSDRIYPCLLISSISLAILILPYMIRTTQNSLEQLPAELRNTGKALGASRLQNILYILLPQSLHGIFSGIFLCIGRSAEDTAVIMLTGAAAIAGIPQSLFNRFEALPYYIYYMSANYRNADELASVYGTTIILLGVSLVLFSLAAVLKKSFERL